MILVDEATGKKYEVPDDDVVALKVAEPSREDRIFELVVEVIEEAATVQRAVATVRPHMAPINLGTDDAPNVQAFLCNGGATADAAIAEAINPRAIASTVLARLRAHGFIMEDPNEEAPSKAAHAAQ